jgi:hypothetical protein
MNDELVGTVQRPVIWIQSELARNETGILFIQLSEDGTRINSYINDGASNKFQFAIPVQYVQSLMRHYRGEE